MTINPFPSVFFISPLLSLLFLIPTLFVNHTHMHAHTLTQTHTSLAAFPYLAKTKPGPADLLLIF